MLHADVKQCRTFFFFSHAYLAWIACVHPYVAFKWAGGKPYDACWPWLHCLVLKAVKHNGAHKHDAFTTGLVQQSTRISAYNRLSKLHSGAHKHTRNKETARMRRNKHPADTCEVMIDSMRSYGLSLDWKCNFNHCGAARGADDCAARHKWEVVVPPVRATIHGYGVNTARRKL